MAKKPASAAPPRTGRVPHVYVIIFSLVVITALASLFIPSGSYERNTAGRVVAGSFQFDGQPDPESEAGLGAPAPPRGWALLFAVLTSPLRGIEDAADIIAFLLIIGGAFKVIEISGAFEAAILRTLDFFGARRKLVIPTAMIVFSVGGAVFGMSEEVLPFVLLFVPLARALGYQPIIGVAIPLVGAGAGFAGAMINPFTLGVAQAIAGLPPLSGWLFRSVVWVLVTTLAITYVMWKASSYRLPPEEQLPKTDTRTPEQRKLSISQLAVLATLAGGIGVIIWGIDAHEWYVIEIGGVFLAIGLLSGLFARIAPSRMARCFLEGGRDLLSAGLVVGFARGIVLLAGETRILDPILFGMASVLENLPGILSVNLMFVFQSLLNFMVPSGSGQAALTMPIMAPLAELTGLTRQVAVLAFQFGDGFSNLIIPTSAVLMGCLEAGKVSYERWFGFAWPLQLWLVSFGVIVLSVAVWIGF